MVLYKKILILFIIIIAIYVLMRLFYRRRVLLQSQNVVKWGGESPLDPPQYDKFSNYKSIEGYTNTNTNIIIPQNLTLNNYFVKSSYNSCFNSNSVINPFSVDILKNVLAKGYRFIDFEICKIAGIDDNPIQVCINSTYIDESNQNSSNTFPLIDAVKTIISYGLTMSDTGATNYYEPLFIHIRIKHGDMIDASKSEFYKNINDILYNTTNTADKVDLGNFIYPLNMVINSGKTNGEKLSRVTLSKIISSNKKCFIILDITNLNSIYTTYFTPAKNVITSGFNTGSIPLYKYDEIRAKQNFFTLTDSSGLSINERQININTDNTINKTTFNISIPSTKYESINYYPYDLAKKYGIQFTTMNFAVNDEGLQKYNYIFNSNNNNKITGFIPMAYVIRDAAKDIRSDIKIDIKRGIYISIIIIILVSLIYTFYTYGGISKTLIVNNKSITGGSNNKNIK